MKIFKYGFCGLASVVLLMIPVTSSYAWEWTDLSLVNPESTRTDMALLGLYVLMALVFSFLCSVAEAVLLSITPSYIAGLQEKKPKLAKLLKQLKQEDVDQSLAAILTLNTIAHTVGAIGSGAKATDVFGSTWVGVFSAVMTLMILFLSEIIPKTLGAVYWRGLVRPTAVFVRILIVTLYPLIWISKQLTQIIAHKKGVHVFSREEFVAMAGIGEQSGRIKASESRIIRNLFRFDSLTAEDIMTPRTVIVTLSQDLTVQEALEVQAHSPFSRILLYGRGLDDVTGFVLKTDMLLFHSQDRTEEKLSSLKRDLMKVAHNIKLSGLLERLLDHRQHIAVVVDEYGGTMGLVTLEDVVETLLGTEIVDEMDKVEDMQAWARQQWSKRSKTQGLTAPR